jgi:hypothetical protein
VRPRFATGGLALVVLVGLGACERSAVAPRRAEQGSEAPAVASAKSDWKGAYAYEWYGGRNAAQTAVFMNYQLDLTASASKPATLTAEGYMTDDEFIVDAVPVGDMLEIRFRSFADGGLKNVSGGQPYAVGSTLFTLGRPKRGREPITVWGSLHPDGAPARGRFFERIRSAASP